MRSDTQENIVHNSAMKVRILQNRIHYLHRVVAERESQGKDARISEEELEALDWALGCVRDSEHVVFEVLACELLEGKGKLFKMLDGTFPTDWESIRFILVLLLAKCAKRPPHGFVLRSMLQFAAECEMQYVPDIYKSIMDITGDGLLTKKYDELKDPEDHYLLLQEESERLLSRYDDEVK